MGAKKFDDLSRASPLRVVGQDLDPRSLPGQLRQPLRYPEVGEVGSGDPHCRTRREPRKSLIERIPSESGKEIGLLAIAFGGVHGAVQTAEGTGTRMGRRHPVQQDLQQLRLIDLDEQVVAAVLVPDPGKDFGISRTLPDGLKDPTNATGRGCEKQ